MNDNQPVPFTEGDAVQMRGQPWLRGTVWEIHPDGTVVVEWNNDDENAFVNPRRLQHILEKPPL